MAEFYYRCHVSITYSFRSIVVGRLGSDQHRIVELGSIATQAEMSANSDVAYFCYAVGHHINDGAVIVFVFLSIECTASYLIE